MLPLKQNVPYLVFFSNAETNFIRVTPGNLDIRSEEALLKTILASYVQKRETINRIDDEARFEDVRDQSSHKVWDTFRKIVVQDNSIYQNKDIYREVHILNLSVLSKNVANVDFISITTDSKNKSLKRYRATLKKAKVRINTMEQTKLKAKKSSRIKMAIQFLMRMAILSL